VSLIDEFDMSAQRLTFDRRRSQAMAAR